MKKTLSAALCIVVCAALCLCALGIGAVRGWRGERDEALSALTRSGDIYEQLHLRGMDAANLAVVAARHLPPEDPHLRQLRAAWETISSPDAAAQALAAADSAITEAAQALSEALPALPSVQASQRDQVYISSLTRTLLQSSGVAGVYSQHIAEFNRRLNDSLTGRIAMLLGVKPLAQ